MWEWDRGSRLCCEYGSGIEGAGYVVNVGAG